MVTSRASSTPTGDRRVRRTQAALARALLQLVEEQDLSRVTVADVAELAGVSRSTFYDHYRDVHELAEAACTAMIDRLIESLPGDFNAADPGQEATESLEAFFASLAEHAGLYRALLGPQGSARVADHIRRRSTVAIEERLREAVERGDAGDLVGSALGLPLDVPAAFTAGALIGVAAEWLQGGCRRSAGEMAALTWPLFHALYGIEGRPSA
ncbi:TetR/AcrR family transcriptional regulator [Nonomuraea gerenzanensis]|uniref:TetR family regulatory protein of MDR cluster n=1 Tax=Nonomuraea gerenzanensis TaxID=93944 RepID=A0A1M4EMH2_9ACTN|nr:TetR/AcrR family transcriptional regulator [Nonomuraea gerenzanensis]UBU11297.1 TetR/AcrR family transcriptional regulator [Nonomuraea gerenzanensis]SBO99773.1 TetR family regulatory protein of MDR cluster [Nonomuraea gerenzanensis]